MKKLTIFPVMTCVLDCLGVIWINNSKNEPKTHTKEITHDTK